MCSKWQKSRRRLQRPEVALSEDAAVAAGRMAELEVLVEESICD